MPRYKYIKDGTTIWVDRSVVEKLKKLRKPGEPLGETLRRILEKCLGVRVREY
jgi:hypothetical protein